MRKLFFAACMLSLGFTGAFAQDLKSADAKTAASAAAPVQATRKMDPKTIANMQAMRLQRELALTSEQSAQLKPILESAQAEQGRVNLNNPELEKKVRAILTPEQNKRFDELKAQREAFQKSREAQQASPSFQKQ